MKDSADEQTNLPVLQWLEGAIGAPLLAYLLNCTTDVVHTITSGGTSLNEKQAELVTAFATLRQAIPDELDEASAKEVVHGWLIQVGTDGRSVARSMHEHTGHAEVAPPVQDDLEAAVVALAFDAYPALLLPPDPVVIPNMDDLNFRVSSLLFRHPQAATFMEAALRDPILKSVFTHEDQHTGRSSPMIYRNTGHGSGLQLSMLPETILRRAWRHLQEINPSPRTLAEEGIEELRLGRDVLAGKSRPIKAKLAFVGVLLPPDGRLDVGDGVIRPVTEEDRRLAPEDLKGQLSGTDASGISTTINYDGDVLLEYDFPYMVRIKKDGPESPGPWPEDLQPHWTAFLFACGSV